MKSLVISLCILLFLFPSIANSKKIECQCEFSEKPWEAYGTNAACVTYSKKNRTSCEVEFAGLSYDKNLLENVLGFDSIKYRDLVFKVAGKYIEALRTDNKELLTDSEFIKTALPIFMRGAYLRKPTNQQIDKKWEQNLKNLDNAIISFFNNKANDIGSVFEGKKQLFETKYEGAYFIVGQGYVKVYFEDAVLNAIFIPGE